MVIANLVQVLRDCTVMVVAILVPVLGGNRPLAFPLTTALDSLSMSCKLKYKVRLLRRFPFHLILHSITAPSLLAEWALLCQYGAENGWWWWYDRPGWKGSVWGKRWVSCMWNSKPAVNHACMKGRHAGEHALWDLPLQLQCACTVFWGASVLSYARPCSGPAPD